MLEEIAQREIFLHRAGEFRKVLGAPRAFGRAVGGEHRVVAALLHHQPQQIGGRERLGLLAPVQELAHQPADGDRSALGQFVAIRQLQRGRRQRQAGAARVRVHRFQRLGAEPALGDVVDALERQVILRLGDEAQIGQCIADLGALVEAETADDAIGNADLDEAVFELAGLVLRTHEDRHLVEPRALTLEPLDRLAHPARFLGRVPHADDLDLLAAIDLGPQGLVVALRILADQP